MIRKQDSPFCVQVELTEGCNLRCSFCGINGIRTKRDNNFKFMTLETATALAKSLADNEWNSRIEFAMHGEPTLNPEINEIISVFRKYLPKAYLMVVSNGGGIVSDPTKKIRRLFKSGLTTLSLDEYTNIKFVPNIFTKLKNYYEDKTNKEWKENNVSLFGAQVYTYPDSGPEGNPHQRRPISKRRIVRIRPVDISTNGTHADLNNHGGAGAVPNEKAQGVRCAKPFREMSVRWDGGVSVCCNDWRGTIPVGNIDESSVEEIWNNKVFRSVRRKLYVGERDFGACNGCDAKSYRIGLLPDKKGKEDLKKPTALDEKIIAKAIAKGPMTKPVLRTWEIN